MQSALVKSGTSNNRLSGVARVATYFMPSSASARMPSRIWARAKLKSTWGGVRVVHAVGTFSSRAPGGAAWARWLHIEIGTKKGIASTNWRECFFF